MAILKSLFSKFSLWTLIFCTTGCSSYLYSNKTSNEELEITGNYYAEGLRLEDIVEANNPAASTRGFASTDLLIEGANLAIQGVKKLIDESQQKYNAEYGTYLANLKFYDANSSVGMLDPQGIAFKGVEFKRTFQQKGKERTKAVYASFSIDERKLEDVYFNSKFYLRLDSLNIDYSKVKVNSGHWYMPWTWFLSKETRFHLDFEITILVNWIDEQGVIHSDVPFGKFLLPVHNIPLNPNDQVRKEFFNSYKGAALVGSSYMIPRSVAFCTNKRGDSEPCFGRGDFSFQIRIVESSKDNFIGSEIKSGTSDALKDIKGEEIIKALKNLK